MNNWTLNSTNSIFSGFYFLNETGYSAIGTAFLKLSYSTSDYYNIPIAKLNFTCFTTNLKCIIDGFSY